MRVVLHQRIDVDRRGEHVRERRQDADHDAPAQRQRQHGVRHEDDEQHVPHLVLRLLEADALPAQPWNSIKGLHFFGKVTTVKILDSNPQKIFGR